MRVRLVMVMLMLGGAVCASCSSSGRGTADNMDDARELWADHGGTTYTVELSFWNILGGTATCEVSVEENEARVLQSDPGHESDCERLAVVENLFDYVDEQLDGKGRDYAEFDNENGHVVMLRTDWDGCMGDACSELIVRLQNVR